MNIDKSPVYPVWTFMKKNLPVEDPYDDDDSLDLLDHYDNLVFLAYAYDSGDDRIIKIVDGAQELISEYSSIWVSINSSDNAISRSEPAQRRAKEVSESLARQIGRRLLGYIGKKNAECMEKVAVFDDFMHKVNQL